MLKLWITALALLFAQQITPMLNNGLRPGPWDVFQQKNLNGKALLDAADKGDIAQVQMLIQEGVDVNTKDPNKNTALYYAATNGHEELCKFLIEQGASTTHGFFDNPIWRTIIASNSLHIIQNFNVIKLLLNPHNLPTKKACSQAMITFLYCLKQNKKKDFISGTLFNESKTLLRPHYACIMRMAYRDINEKHYMSGNTALIDAIKGAKLDACQWLIQHGADVNIRNTKHHVSLTALSIARIEMQYARERFGKDRSAQSICAHYTKICDLLIANGAIEDKAK